jgi:hypothetical protein
MRSSVEFHVAGTNHEEIIKKTQKLISDYLGVDDIDKALSLVDAEIHAEQKDTNYEATVYVRIRA